MSVRKRTWNHRTAVWRSRLRRHHPTIMRVLRKLEVPIWWLMTEAALLQRFPVDLNHSELVVAGLVPATPSIKAQRCSSV